MTLAAAGKGRCAKPDPSVVRATRKADGFFASVTKLLVLAWLSP